MYYTVDLESFLTSLKKISIPLIVALLLVGNADRFLMAYKWWHLCQALNMTTPFSLYVKLYYISSFLSYAVPSAVGGEVYRAIRLSRGEESHNVLASIFMEKIIGILSVVSFAWVGVLYLLQSQSSEKMDLIFYILLVFSVIFISIALLAMHVRVQAFFITFLQKYKFSTYLEKLSKSYSEFRYNKSVLCLNFIIALVETSVQYLMVLGIAYGLDIRLEQFDVIAIIAISEFVRRIAMLIDGWGLATVLQVFLYGIIGMSGAEALLLSLLSRVIFFGAGLPGGLFLVFDRWALKSKD